MTDTLTRTAADTTVPAAGTYEIDPAHSSISFQVRHLGLSKVRGGFEHFTGVVRVAEDPAHSSVEVQIDASSFTTGNEDRDGHITSPDFLDVEQHPTLDYRSTGVRQEGERWQVDGELTAVGISRPVTLDVEFEGAGEDPWGNGRVAFSAETEIDRDEWGVSWNQTLESGGLLIGRKITIVIDVQAVAQG